MKNQSLQVCLSIVQACKKPPQLEHIGYKGYLWAPVSALWGQKTVGRL